MPPATRASPRRAATSRRRWPTLAGDAERALSLDFGTEAGLYQQRLGVPVVICGPGDMEQAHRADEFISVEQLVRGAAFFERLLAVS